MSDKKLVSDSTVNYLVNRIKNDYIPFKDILDLQEKVINPPTNTCESVEFIPDTNYEGFSTITINELNPEEVTVQSTAEQQVINNKYISKVTVEPIIYENKTVTLTQDNEEILPDTDEAMNSVTINPKKIINSQEKTVRTAAITKTITPDEGNILISKLTVNPSNKLQDILAGNLFNITDEDLPENYTIIPAYIAPNIEHIDVNHELTLNTIICEKGIHPSEGNITPTGEIVEGIKYENLKSLNTNGRNIVIERGAFLDNQYLTTIPAQNGMYIVCKSHAFENSAITSVPPIYTGDSYGNNELGNYAFYNCKDLEEIHFYGTLEHIGDYAFAGCTKLTSVYFPNAGYVGSRLPGSIGKHAFEGCTGLTSISFNYSAPTYYGVNIMSKIDDYAFKDCTSLTNAQLINAFETGTGIFEDCTSLTSITLPESGYTLFGANMFKGCTSLSSIISPIPPIRWDFIGRFGTDQNKIFEGTAITELELAPLTVVSSYSDPEILLGMDNLKKLTVHDVLVNNATFYSDAAIYIPYNVEHIVIDNRTRQDTPSSSDVYVGLKNFKSSDHDLNINTSLKKVEYINSTRALDDFSDCVNLTDVSLCEGLTETPKFYGCTNLTNINLPNTITAIGDYAFYNCSGLTNIDLTSTVTSIGSNAFYNCTNLTNINLPNTITAIGDYAFHNCSGLTSLNLPNITSLGSAAFEYCTNLTSVDLSNAQITEIAGWMFQGCTALTSVNLPNTLIAFNGWQTFAECTSLVDITLPDNFTTGGIMTFSNCSNLQTVSLGPNITDLPSTFYYCTALTTITVRGNSSCATAQTLQAIDPSDYNNATIVYTEN